MRETDRKIGCIQVDLNAIPFVPCVAGKFKPPRRGRPWPHSDGPRPFSVAAGPHRCDAAEPAVRLFRICMPVKGHVALRLELQCLGIFQVGLSSVVEGVVADPEREPSLLVSKGELAAPAEPTFDTAPGADVTIGGQVYRIHVEQVLDGGGKWLHNVVTVTEPDGTINSFAPALTITPVNDPATCPVQLWVGTPGDDNNMTAISNGVWAGIPAVMIGLGGDDTIDGTILEDIIVGNGGNDEIGGDKGADKIWGGSGNDFIYGFEGADTIVGGPGDDELYGHRQGDSLWGEDGCDKLFGHWDNDVLIGGADDDITLEGGDLDDTVWGGAGDDTIAGSTGDDKLYAGAGGDKEIGRAHV